MNGPDRLLKKATEFKRKGEIGEAISLLRQAYKEIERGEIIYPVQTFLRLPMYLQEAGKSDEAWGELNRLILEGYPNQLKDPGVIPMDHSIIYDKMRLFLEKEGRNDLAVRFGMLSYIYWALGLHRQSRRAELEKHLSRDVLRELVEKLLKKAKKSERVDELLGVISGQIARFPNIDFSKFAESIDAVLLRRE